MQSKHRENKSLITHHLNGKVHAFIPFNDDMKTIHGTKRIFHSNGNVRSEIQYEKGIKNGFERWFFDNKDLSSEMFHKTGMIEGLLKQNRINRSINFHQVFKQGEEHGVGVSFEY